MGMGIIAGALAGAGDAGERAGAALQKRFSDEDLQRMRIEADRDLHVMIEGLREKAAIGAEERKRAPAIRAGQTADGIINSRIQSANQVGTQEAAALAGSGAPITAAAALPEREEALIRADALAKEGETEAAHRYRQDVRDMDRITATREDRKATLAEQGRQHDEQARHNVAMERIQAATASRMAELTKVQMEGARFELEGKKELKKMQDDFAAETDPAKRATMERNILTRLGKAKELPEPVKAYVETVKAELATYAKAEAEGANGLPPSAVQRRNELQRQMQNLATTGTLGIGTGRAQPSAEDIAGLKQLANNPRAIKFFDGIYGEGAAAKYLERPRNPPAGAAASDSDPLAKPIPDFIGGPEVDAARSRVMTAQAKLQSYGALKIRQDPAGYAAAQADLDEARRASDQALETYQRAVGFSGPAASAVPLRQK